MEEGFSEAAPPDVARPAQAAPAAGLQPQPQPAPAAAAAVPAPAAAACGSSPKTSERSEEERTQAPHSQQGEGPAAAAAGQAAGPLEAAAALLEVASPLKAVPTEADSGQAAVGSQFCQVPDCSSELQEDEARYYKRFRICRYHASLPSLLLDGVQVRFCQQCARFQPIIDFDGARKSCRASLEKHNARRRRTAGNAPPPYTLLSATPTRGQPLPPPAAHQPVHHKPGGGGSGAGRGQSHSKQGSGGSAPQHAQQQEAALAPLHRPPPQLPAHLLQQLQEQESAHVQRLLLQQFLQGQSQSQGQGSGQMQPGDSDLSGLTWGPSRAHTAPAPFSPRQYNDLRRQATAPPSTSDHQPLASAFAAAAQLPWGLQQQLAQAAAAAEARQAGSAFVLSSTAPLIPPLGSGGSSALTSGCPPQEQQQQQLAAQQYLSLAQQAVQAQHAQQASGPGGAPAWLQQGAAAPQPQPQPPQPSLLPPGCFSQNSSAIDDLLCQALLGPSAAAAPPAPPARIDNGSSSGRQTLTGAPPQLMPRGDSLRSQAGLLPPLPQHWCVPGGSLQEVALPPSPVHPWDPPRMPTMPAGGASQQQQQQQQQHYLKREREESPSAGSGGPCPKRAAPEPLFTTTTTATGQIYTPDQLQDALERVSLRWFHVPSEKLAPHVREGVISLIAADPEFADHAAPP